MEVQNDTARPGFDYTVDMQHITRVDLPSTHEFVVSKGTRHHNDLVFDQQVHKLLKCFAKQAHFEPAGVIVEHDSDTIAPCTNIQDQPGNRHVSPWLSVLPFAVHGLGRWFRRDVDEVAINQKPGIRADSIEWVTGQVQTQGLFLVRKKLSLTPFRQNRLR